MSKPIIRTGGGSKAVVVPSGGPQTVAFTEGPVTVQPSEDNPVVVTPLSGKPGPPGPTGPVGPSGSAANGFTFHQAVPATTWVITHNLGFPPAVTVIDTSGAVVEGDVVYAGATVTLTFSAAFAGVAHLS